MKKVAFSLALIGANRCSHHEFRCQNNQCINRRARCDGIRHCRDGSDEIQCGMSQSTNTLTTCVLLKHF